MSVPPVPPAGGTLCSYPYLPIPSCTLSFPQPTTLTSPPGVREGFHVSPHPSRPHLEKIDYQSVVLEVLFPSTPCCLPLDREKWVLVHVFGSFICVCVMNSKTLGVWHALGEQCFLMGNVDNMHTSIVFNVHSVPRLFGIRKFAKLPFRLLLSMVFSPATVCRHAHSAKSRPSYRTTDIFSIHLLFMSYT